jgi:hypothetical protein
MSKSLKQIMREVSPENQQRELKDSQRDMDKQLSDMVAQLRRQAESTFGDQTWVEASWPEFSERLKSHGEALIKLSECLALNTPKA